LAGYSCAPFRLLTHRYGKPAFCCTEMISAKTLIHHPKVTRTRYTWKDPDEGKLCYQLSGEIPSDIALATKMVTDCGADLIDLNCGCPVTKIRAKGAGSKLLADTLLLSQLIKAMRENTHLPISIKIRVDGDSNESFNREVARTVEESGADFLVVHGRHWTERYDVNCRFDDIRQFVESVKIPVIGNGDIECVETLNEMLATGCAGVMIARASVGQPWLFEKLRFESRGETFEPPNPALIGEIFLEHVERLAALIQNEKFAVLQARKFGKYYARYLTGSAKFSDALNQAESISELKLLVQMFFEKS